MSYDQYLMQRVVNYCSNKNYIRTKFDIVQKCHRFLLEIDTISSANMGCDKQFILGKVFIYIDIYICINVCVCVRAHMCIYTGCFTTSGHNCRR